MYLRFWGTRGSIPSPGPKTAKYGGNTSCTAIRTDDGTIIVLDCGTGVRELGLELLRSAPKPIRVHLFIGHTHWDHIQGFPFFVPAFLNDSELNIYAPLGFQRSLEDAMSGQMEYAYFPVKLQDLRSRIHFTELEEGFFRIGDILVETQYLNHTAPTIGYRISSGGATIAYVTDHEPFWKTDGKSFTHPGDQRHIAFMKGADLVIHDAQYTEEEYCTKVGWGHSPIEYVTDIAMAADVGRLVLYHHDPTHDDAKIDQIEAAARARVAAAGSSLEILAAREGLELEVRGEQLAREVAEDSAFRRQSIAGGRILVVSSDDTEVSSIERVLLEDGLVLFSMPDNRTAYTNAAEASPDLAILNERSAEGDLPFQDLIRELRTQAGQKNLPVVLLSDGIDDPGLLQGGETAPNDYVAKPFSPPMLRSRVRAWLARSFMSNGARLERQARRALKTTHYAPPDAGVTPAVPVGGIAGSLATLPLFRSLTREQLEGLTAHAIEQTYPAGHVVIREGEFGDNLFVVLSGRFRVMEAAPDAAVELFLGELGAGEVFGELGLLKDQPRSATVVAVERSRCVLLPRGDFLRTLESSASLSIALLRVLAGRLYAADRLLARYAPDPLTGLPGRRALHDQYQRLCAGARRNGGGLILLVFDVIHLKSINDQHGYAVGDEVLRTVVDALLATTRTTDFLSRHGGDEFVVLLTGGPKDIDLIVGRVQAKLAEMSSERGLPAPFQCSVGMAASQSPPDSIDELLRTADRDMHRRKAG